MKGELAEMKSEKKINGYDRYEVEDAFRALQRSIEIRNDSKLMAAVRLLAKQRAKETAAILGEEPSTEQGMMAKISKDRVK